MSLRQANINTWEIAKMSEQYGQIYLIILMDLVRRFSCCGRILKAQSLASILMKSASATLSTSIKCTFALPPEEHLNDTGLQECICSERFTRSAETGQAYMVDQPSSISAWPIWFSTQYTTISAQDSNWRHAIYFPSCPS